MQTLICRLKVFRLKMAFEYFYQNVCTSNECFVCFRGGFSCGWIKCWIFIGHWLISHRALIEWLSDCFSASILQSLHAQAHITQYTVWASTTISNGQTHIEKHSLCFIRFHNTEMKKFAFDVQIFSLPLGHSLLLLSPLVLHACIRY